MSNLTLQEKQRQLEDEHFTEVAKSHLEHHDQKFTNRAYEIRGALRTVGSLANNLMSQHIRGLMMIEEEKLWRGLGYDSFADFLTNDDSVIPSKGGYYDQRAILINSSDGVLDAITGKISAKKVKALLASGVEMSVEDGQLKIGDEAVEVGDVRMMSTVVEGFHQTLVERDQREKEQTTQIEKLSTQLERGQEDFNDLQRRYDLAVETSDFDRVWSTVQSSMYRLAEQAALLPENEKSQRGEGILKQIADLTFGIRDGFGIKGGIGADEIERRQRVAAMKPVSEMTDEEKNETFEDRALAEIFGDDDD